METLQFLYYNKIFEIFWVILEKGLDFFLKILENVFRISPHFGKLENDLYGHT